VSLIALVLVTAVWGITFVQVKDAVAIYPLFAFLAVRYAIATGALGLVGATRVRTLGRSGLGAGAVLEALGGLGIAGLFGYLLADDRSGGSAGAAAR